MNILLTGGSGQLGSELRRQADGGRIAFSAPGRAELDLSDPRRIRRQLSARDFDAVVNAAAYTQVDRAESEAETAMAVNARAPAALARECRDRGIPLIHISTDYVFDGRKGSPYTEADAVAPLNVYGRSKAEGESAVRDTWDRHLILRTSWLYSAYGSNFLKTILRLAGEREELRVVDDQIGSPTCAADLAGAILNLLGHIRSGRKTPWGTYHYASAGSTSWCGFAARILAALAELSPGRRVHLTPIGTPDYPTPAARPAFSVLDCRRIEELFGLTPPPWPTGVARTVRRLLQVG
jgi:dTDP-4-dehydrorhamnose reductase